MPAYPADLYAALHTGTPGDVTWYQTQCEGARSVLELGCGYGRILSALASTEREVWGIEIDPNLLELSRERIGTLPHAERASIHLVHGDMRSFDLGRTFDRILIPHSGLYCLLGDADVRSCLRAIRRHLDRSGCLLLDAYSADRFHLRSRPSDVDSDDLVPVARVEARDRTWQVLECSTWDRVEQRIDVTYEYVAQGESHQGRIAHRYLQVKQLRAALEEAGLRLASLHGSFDGKRYEVGDVLWAARAVVAVGD